MNDPMTAAAQIDRTTALGLFNTGRSFWRSAEQLRASPPKVTHPEAPQTFLFCHSIELYLKAFLRAAGRSVDDLKRIGHRISKLGMEAAMAGLALSPEHAELLVHIDEADVAIEARYIVTGFKQQPAPEALASLCAALDQTVGASLSRQGLPVRAEQFSAPKPQTAEDPEDAKRRRERSISNLRLLRDWEEEALCWIYHSTGGRCRASINHSGIRGLYDHGLLVTEDQKGHWTDRIFLIPPHIMEVLKAMWKEPDRHKVSRQAPWERQRI
jgi:hypothetical protein